MFILIKHKILCSNQLLHLPCNQVPVINPAAMRAITIACVSCFDIDHDFKFYLLATCRFRVVVSRFRVDVCRFRVDVCRF